MSEYAYRDKAPSPHVPLVAAVICICVTIGVGLIPFLGFFAWIIAVPMLIASFVLSIVALSRGALISGVIVLISTVTIAPACIFFAPLISSALGLGGAAVASHQIDEARATPEPEALATPEPIEHPARGAAATPPPSPVEVAATPEPKPRPLYATEQEAQKAAIARYPGLAVQGSPFNVRFTALYREKKAAEPDFFTENDWPIRLAKLVADGH